MTHQSLHEVQRLIDALCDRALLPDDAGRLDELLANDPLARQAYLEQVWIEAELYSISMPLDGNDAHEEWAAQSRRGEIRWFRDARLSIWLALAASMLVAATVSVWLTLQGVDGRGPLAFLRSDAEADAPATAPLDELAVAQVTGTRDCLWGAASSKVGFGTKL